MRKNICKSALSIILAVVVFASISGTAFANSYEENKTDYQEIVTLSIGEIDLTKPFEYTQTFVTADGEIDKLIISFTPNLSRQNAVVGTWSLSSVNLVPAQSFNVDMVRNGAGWRLENARNHAFNGAFMRFPSSSLSIGRHNTTTSLAAEVTGSVSWNLFDTSWFGPIASGTVILIMRVSHNGTVTALQRTN